MENERSDFFEITQIPETEQQNAIPQPRPWGFWATLGFTCIIGVVFLTIQVVIFLAFIIYWKMTGSELEINKLVEVLETDGLLISISTISTAVFTILFVFLFAGIKKHITVKQYLSLKNPGLKQFVIWFFVLILFVVFQDALTWLLKKPIVPDVMKSIYSNTGFLPLFWFAMIIAAPLAEELVFRSFLFKGIHHSILGPVGAVIITSLSWSVLHLQYDLYGIAQIFVGGLLVGYAMVKTKSIYIPIMMHVAMNLIATIECAIAVSGS